MAVAGRVGHLISSSNLAIRVNEVRHTHGIVGELVIGGP